MATKTAIEETFMVPQEERRRDYEMTLVLSGKAGDEDRETVLSKIRTFVADHDGEIIELSPPKEYPLSYPIRKERQGVLRTLVFRSSPELPNLLADELKHEAALLRHLLIERPKQPVTPRRIFKPLSEGAAAETTSPSDKPAVDETKQDEQIEGAIKGL